jgi:hypothetical protein
MKSAIKSAAIAAVIMGAMASAAWAQGYTPTSPGTQGSYTSNPATSTYNPGASTYNPNQESWSSGTQGTSTPYAGQSYSQAGYGMGNITTFQQAEQELRKYGYDNVRDVRSMQGWSADAMRNGQKVHVIIGDNGLIATFPGR